MLKESIMPSTRKHKRTKCATGIAAKTPTFRRAYSGSQKTAAGVDNLIDEAVSIWQNHTDKQLTHEDGRQIVENLTGFFGILQEWRFAEQVAEIKKTKKKAAPEASKDVMQPTESQLTNIG